MNPVILFRNSNSYSVFNNRFSEIDEEQATASKYFPVFNFRHQIPEDSFVIGRYSILPFFREFEEDMKVKRCKLINNCLEYSYVADILNYYEDLKEFTPKTYTEWGNLGEGKWVVKGKTNSRKFNWNTHMYAEGRTQLLQVIKNNLEDPFISEQGIVVREYVPLKRIEKD